MTPRASYLTDREKWLCRRLALQITPRVNRRTFARVEPADWYTALAGICGYAGLDVPSHAAALLSAAELDVAS